MKNWECRNCIYRKDRECKHKGNTVYSTDNEVEELEMDSVTVYFEDVKDCKFKKDVNSVRKQTKKDLK